MTEENNTKIEKIALDLCKKLLARSKRSGKKITKNDILTCTRTVKKFLRGNKPLDEAVVELHSLTKLTISEIEDALLKAKSLAEGRGRRLLPGRSI